MRKKFQSPKKGFTVSKFSHRLIIANANQIKALDQSRLSLNA